MSPEGDVSPRLRLLIVGLNYAPEPIGIAPYTAGLAEYLADRGHHVEVVAGRPYYPQWRPYDGHRALAWRRSREDGVTVIRCPHYIPERPTGARRMVHHASFAAAALPIVISRALRTRPDVVLAIAPSLLSTLPARIGAVLGRARLWVHVQDFEADAALATGLVRTGVLTRGLFAVERAILRAADVVSTIGPQMMERLRQKGVPAERTFELRNWASAAAPAASAGGSYRSEWNLQDRKVALYAGSLGRKQGAGLILAAARLLAKRADIAFVICGEGPELEALKAEARDLGNVRFNPLQPVERLGELLAMADFHLLPQITAAADLVLPSKLTNMLLSRRPVVATAEPGTGLDAEVEGCGIVVPPGDAVALATAVAQLADDPALARRLGEAAGVRAAERWSRTAILARFERRLGALAAEGGGAHFGVVTAPSDP